MIPELDHGLPKPLDELTVQEIRCLLAITNDAVFDCAKDLTALQNRYKGLADELTRRSEL
jgi:hypothetical protein